MRPSTRIGIGLLAATFLVLAGGTGGAVHFYRGPGGGCTPAEGALSSGGAGEVAATVLMLHNTFQTAPGEGVVPGSPVTVIEAGQAVRWVWNSSHCHSVLSGLAPAPVPDGDFYSGFHYPTTPPESPQVLEGLFEYPVPDLTPTLSFTHTFDEPGVYAYTCEHHAAIGMVGVVVVQ